MNNNMKKKGAALWAVLALAGVIAAAVVAYGWLRDRTEAPDILLALGQEADADNSLETDESSEAPSDDLPETNGRQEAPSDDSTESDSSPESYPNNPEDNPHQPENEEPQPQAPDFTMHDMYGNEVRLSDFFGKPIVLNFWTTWCPACIVEMPYFEWLYEELGSEIHILKVNLPNETRGETRERVEQFIADNEHGFPVYFDTGEGAMVYGVRGIPVTFFIDAGGYAVAQAQGPVNEDTLRRGLELAGVE